VYQLLKGDDERALRLERLGNLETEHCRVGLRLEEADSADTAALLAQRQDLERRMNVHLKALAPPAAAVTAEPAIESPPSEEVPWEREGDMPGTG
jgi:hypothetical protein